MRKFLSLLCAAMFSSVVWADCGFWSEGGGYVSYSVDGVENILTCNASNTQPLDLGTIESLFLSNFTVKVWKNGTSDVTGTEMH